MATTFTWRDVFADLLLLLRLFFVNIYFTAQLLWHKLLPASRAFKSLDNNLVLITGAAGGIGRLLVSKLFELNCRIIAVDNNAEQLNALRRDLYSRHAAAATAAGTALEQRLFFYQCDIASTGDIRTLRRRLAADLGGSARLDILVNNAGVVNGGKLLLELSDAEVRRVFDVNALAPMWMCREFLPDMLAAGTGHIVNVASVCGLLGAYRLTDYCASKFACVGFTESLRMELKVAHADTSRIVVSTVCPFHILTDMFKGADVKRLKWLNLSMTPEFAVENIVKGIRMNKELILIPSQATAVFAAIKYLLSTKFVDYALIKLDVSKSMDNLRHSQ